MSTKREQELVDICFQLVLAARNERNKKFFEGKSNDEITDWVRERLRGCGYEISGPIGISWGILRYD